MTPPPFIVTDILYLCIYKKKLAEGGGGAGKNEYPLLFVNSILLQTTCSYTISS